METWNSAPTNDAAALVQTLPSPCGPDPLLQQELDAGVRGYGRGYTLVHSAQREMRLRICVSARKTYHLLVELGLLAVCVFTGF